MIDDLAELLAMDEPRRRFAGMLSGLVHYDLGNGHPVVGWRKPDPYGCIASINGVRPQVQFDGCAGLAHCVSSRW